MFYGVDVFYVYLSVFKDYWPTIHLFVDCLALFCLTPV